MARSIKTLLKDTAKVTEATLALEVVYKTLNGNKGGFINPLSSGLKKMHTAAEAYHWVETQRFPKDLQRHSQQIEIAIAKIEWAQEIISLQYALRGKITDPLLDICLEEDKKAFRNLNLEAEDLRNNITAFPLASPENLESLKQEFQRLSEPYPDMYRSKPAPSLIKKLYAARIGFVENTLTGLKMDMDQIMRNIQEADALKEAKALPLPANDSPVNEWLDTAIDNRLKGTRTAINAILADALRVQYLLIACEKMQENQSYSQNGAVKKYADATILHLTQKPA